MSERIDKSKWRRHLFLPAVLTTIATLLVMTLCCYLKIRHEQQNDDLIAAIQRNDVHKVITLLHDGADANAQYAMRDIKTLEEIALGHTPSPYSHDPTWQTLLNRISGRRPTNDKRISALIVALDDTLECPSHTTLPPKDTRIIAALLENGADVNARGRGNNTPLLLALGDDRHDAANLLLSRKPDLSLRNDYGSTTLMEAAYGGDVDLVAFLLGKGVDIDLQNKSGSTALMYAIDGRGPNDVQVVRFLLDHHARTDLTGKDMMGQGGETALKLAQYMQKEKIVQMLQAYVKERNEPQ